MIPNIFNGSEMLRIGWALFHSLWQGIAIALALKGVLILAAHRSSRLRYALTLICLFLMAALPVFLLSKPQRSLSDFPAARNAVYSGAGSAVFSTAASSIHREVDFGSIAARFIKPLVPWIAAIWFFGLALLFLKTIGGIIQVRRIKQKASAPFDINGTASFRRLAERAKVSDVPVLESDIVFTPTVAGWVKPVVLLPKGFLEKIGRPELDALVAHEFAHIRRQDNVTNLFQTVVENLLFFHPAMWWVSRRVRAEREACCDDDAVAICGDTLVYVRALSQAEQFRSSFLVSALCSSPLLQRIRRLTEMRISKSSRIPSFCIALSAVFFIAATAAGSILLATIPQQDSKTSVSATVNGVDQQSDRIEGAGAAFQEKKKTAQLKTAVVDPQQFVHKTAKPKTVVVDPKQFVSKGQKDSKGNLVGGISGGVAGSAAAPVIEGTIGGITGGLRQDKALPAPPPPPKKDDTVPGKVVGVKLIHKVDPVFPNLALRARISGKVVLKLIVGEDGTISVQEVKGHPLLNEAAIDAVKQWKYSLDLVNVKAPVAITVTVVFTYAKDGSPKIIAPDSGH
jgi:TonB family protein